MTASIRKAVFSPNRTKPLAAIKPDSSRQLSGRMMSPKPSVVSATIEKYRDGSRLSNKPNDRNNTAHTQTTRLIAASNQSVTAVRALVRRVKAGPVTIHRPVLLRQSIATETLAVIMMMLIDIIIEPISICANISISQVMSAMLPLQHLETVGEALSARLARESDPVCLSPPLVYGRVSDHSAKLCQTIVSNVYLR